MTKFCGFEQVWLWPLVLSSVVIMASDLRLNGREFDHRPVGTDMGDRLWAGVPGQYVTSHPGQLGLLPSMTREMSTGQSAVMLCGWE